MKRTCAKKAFELVKDGMIVGLGGGSTVGFLIEELEVAGTKIWAVTPSQDTMGLCMKHHIPVMPLEMIDHIDIAFDGCDELDAELNALKSCGGIHVREKIVAAMATDYVLLGDENKYHDKLEFAYPVTVEVIPSARSYVRKRLVDLGSVVKERTSDQKMGVVVSDDGNYLMEAVFAKVDDIQKLSETLDGIPGLVGHSLFYHIASKAIIAKKDSVELVSRR